MKPFYKNQNQNIPKAYIKKKFFAFASILAAGNFCDLYVFIEIRLKFPNRSFCMKDF